MCVRMYFPDLSPSQNVLNSDLKKSQAWPVCLKSGHPSLDVQIKQQSDLDDAREITVFWTYFKENLTVVIGNKHQVHYIAVLPTSLCNIARRRGHLC